LLITWLTADSTNGLPMPISITVVHDGTVAAAFFRDSAGIESSVPMHFS
jgi:hypothetical protein